MRTLFESWALPARLSAAGVSTADLPRIAGFSLAMLQHHSVSGNARAIGDLAEIEEILRLAW